jgi:hypothetical protein
MMIGIGTPSSHSKIPLPMPYSFESLDGNTRALLYLLEAIRNVEWRLNAE